MKKLLIVAVAVAGISAFAVHQHQAQYEQPLGFGWEDIHQRQR